MYHRKQTRRLELRTRQCSKVPQLKREDEAPVMGARLQVECPAQCLELLHRFSQVSQPRRRRRQFSFNERKNCLVRFPGFRVLDHITPHSWRACGGIMQSWGFPGFSVSWERWQTIVIVRYICLQRCLL